MACLLKLLSILLLNIALVTAQGNLPDRMDFRIDFRRFNSTFCHGDSSDPRHMAIAHKDDQLHNNKCKTWLGKHRGEGFEGFMYWPAAGSDLDPIRWWDCKVVVYKEEFCYGKELEMMATQNYGRCKALAAGWKGKSVGVTCGGKAVEHGGH